MIPLLLPAAAICPFLILLDYHKKKNIRQAIIYLIVFFILVGGVLPFLALRFRMLFTMCVPVIFLLFAICIQNEKYQTRYT